MRILVAFTGVVFAAAVVIAQDAVPPTPHPVSPICDWAFSQAVERAQASPEALIASPEAATATAEPGAGASASAPTGFEHAYLDDAIRMCAGIEDWLAGAALHPGATGDMDPFMFLMFRCDDPATGLDAYATCVTLVHALATPSPPPHPTPTPTPTPKPTPSPKAKPAARPTATPTPKPTPATARSAVTKPRTQLNRVPSVRAAVPGATRIHYFEISGKSHRQLSRSIRSQISRYCKTHRAWACVEIRPRFRPSYVQNRYTGSCIITGVRTSLVTVAHIPRWTAPRRVPAYLAWWWQRVVERIGWHEAQHGRIAKTHIARFPRMVVGKSCYRYNRQMRRWGIAENRAQDAFDRRDYPRGDAVSSRWMREASERFPVYRKGARVYWR